MSLKGDANPIVNLAKISETKAIIAEKVTLQFNPHFRDTFITASSCCHQKQWRGIRENLECVNKGLALIKGLKDKKAGGEPTSRRLSPLNS